MEHRCFIREGWVALRAGGATTTDVHSANSRRTIRERVGLLNLYVAGVGVCAFVLGYVFWSVQVNWDVLPPMSAFGPNYTLPGFALFLMIGVLADHYRVRVAEGSEISAGFLADFLSAALLGPLPGALVAAGAFLIGNRKVQWLRTIFNTFAFVIVGGTTGVVYWLVEAWLGHSAPTILLGGLLAGCTYFVGNFLLFYPVMHLRTGIGFSQMFDEGFRPFLPFHMFFLALSLGLIYSFDQMGPPGFALFFLPVVGLVYAFRTYSHQRELARSLERFSLQIAASMITALDLKDNYTAQHSAAVAQYARDTASAFLPTRRPARTPSSAPGRSTAVRAACACSTRAASAST